MTVIFARSACAHHSHLLNDQSLFELVKEKVYNLVRMSKENAERLLVKHMDVFPVASVVRQLRREKSLQLWLLPLFVVV